MNLLNYPGLDRQRRRRHRWRTALAGFLAGVVLAAAGVHEMVSRLPHLQREQQRLQSLQGTQKQQQTSLQQQQRQQGQLQEQVLHLQVVAQHHQAWEALYQALQREAQDGALQWLNLELGQDRLVLQGRAPSLSSMDQARERLSQKLGMALSLSSVLITPTREDVSLLAGAEVGAERLPPVAFVWHADWPVLRTQPDKRAGLAPDTPATKPLP